MTPESPEQRPVPSRSRRDDTIQALTNAFAQDELTIEEFERRLDVAHRTSAPAELDALLSDLKVVPVQATPAPRATPDPQAAVATVASASEVRAQQTLVAVMGGVERKGPWTPARHNQVFAMMGGAELDFREARMGPGETVVTIVACMGGVEIIVPPGMHVDANGVAIMGGFAHTSPPPTPAPGAPILRINGFVLMGGVDISVRLPGERGADARKRERAERKRLRGGDPS
jgi:hypothetical protein